MNAKVCDLLVVHRAPTMQYGPCSIPGWRSDPGVVSDFHLLSKLPSAMFS